MTAHRLNRNEYSNTIRDLLGVQFRADKDFPVDDSGDGFDNIGDVLTVSPLLMERYLSAAERIARWAISTEIPRNRWRLGIWRARAASAASIAAPSKRITVSSSAANTPSASVCPENVRPSKGLDAAPVKLGLWMDGNLIATQIVETKPSGLVYFNPYSEEGISAVAARRRSRVPGGLHRRRVRADPA
jgi:hypothetical protein